jgi:translation initiation factor IF-3
MTEDALARAIEKGLDLVEVAPNANPPVCKILDYGKMKYDKKKRDATARKRQSQVQLKEIKVRPKTDDHDMNVKVRAAASFLKAGNKVKVTVRFRGREHAHHDIGADQCMRLFKAVKDFATIEMAPRMEGRQMTMIIASTFQPPIRGDDSDEMEEEENFDNINDDVDNEEDDDDASEEVTPEA